MAKAVTSIPQQMSPQRPSNKFQPPFGRQSSPYQHQSSTNPVEYELKFPAVIHLKPSPIRPKKNPLEFLRWDLETPRLDCIYHHLWLAGRMQEPARPLHRQKMVKHSIVITENMDEHLLAVSPVIFIKPLPEQMLSFEFWERYLCSDDQLYREACGFFLSYTWLVAFASDFRIAKEEHLIPESLDWTAWTTMVDEFLDFMDRTPNQQHIAKRYHYGELSIPRLNYIYKLSPTLLSWDNFMNGFLPASMWYRPFLERNLTRLLALFVFFSVILSALQVGVATDRLQHNADFQKVSYGFAVASLTFVLFGAWAIAGMWFAPRFFRLVRYRLSKSASVKVQQYP